MPEVERRQPEHVAVPAVETPVESAAAQQRFVSRGAVPPPAAEAQLRLIAAGRASDIASADVIRPEDLRRPHPSTTRAA